MLQTKDKSGKPDHGQAGERISEGWTWYSSARIVWIAGPTGNEHR